MPRLIDDIRTQGRLQMPWFVLRHKEDAWASIASKIWELLQDRELPVLLVDNVADYYFASEQEYWDLVDDFPNLAPPYPQFWSEYHLPAKIHSKERGDSMLPMSRGRCGVLITAAPPEDVVATDLPAGTRWILWCELFIDYGHRENIGGPHGSILLCVDEHGVLIDTPSIQTFCDPEHAEIMRAHVTWLHPVLLAVSFLHCKNVTIVDNSMPKPLAKKFRAKHNREPARYKTLVIEPLKQVLRTQGRSGEVGLQKALHICRGHFRDYREGRGLFGKYHGQFWIPAIVRGTRGESAPPREVKIKV
jgi:hypothetical protein